MKEWYSVFLCLDNSAESQYNFWVKASDMSEAQIKTITYIRENFPSMDVTSISVHNSGSVVHIE